MQSILVIEDNEDLLEVITDTLVCENYVVQSFEKVDPEMYTNFPPGVELVISDWSVPGLRLDKLVEVVKSKNISIMLISGMMDLSRVNEANDLGVDKFLAKPFALEELVRAVDEIFRKRKGDAVDSEEEFHPVYLDEVVLNKIFSFSFYFKLGQKKYVKLNSSAHSISVKLIESYQENGIRYLYLKYEDYVKFVQSINSDLSYLSIAAKKNSEALQRVSQYSIEVLNSFFEKIKGTDEREVEEAKVFTNSLIRLLGSESNFSDFFSMLVRQEKSVFSHNILTCSIFIYLASKTYILDHKILSDFVLGVFFHDLGLKEIRSEMQFSSGLKGEDLDEYMTHQQRSFELVGNFEALNIKKFSWIQDHHSLNKLTTKHSVPRDVAIMFMFADEICDYDCKVLKDCKYDIKNVGHKDLNIFDQITPDEKQTLLSAL